MKMATGFSNHVAVSISPAVIEIRVDNLICLPQQDTAGVKIEFARDLEESVPTVVAYRIETRTG